MRKILFAAAMTLPLAVGAAHAQDSLKIGYIDPLSGGGASVGEGGLKTFQFLADELNAKGGIIGHKVEIVPMDNKTNPQESLVQAQKRSMPAFITSRKAMARPSAQHWRISSQRTTNAILARKCSISIMPPSIRA